MKELSEIITYVRQAIAKNSISPSDDIILDVSVRIYNSQNVQTKMSNYSKENPATQKQINYLKGLKIKIPPNLTSKEASKLIEENKDAKTKS